MNNLILNNKFNCERCGYNTNKLSNFKRHLTNKLICDAKLSDVSNDQILQNLESYLKLIKKKKLLKKETKKEPKKEIKKFICEYCNKSYCSSFSKSRHKSTCKEKEFYEKMKIYDDKIQKIEKIIENNAGITINQVNNINNNNNINNLNVNINIITNLEEFNSKAINTNLNSLFSIGTYLVDKFLENKCQYFIDCIQDFKKKVISEHDFSVVSNICKIILQSDNPLTKNMFMDNKNDTHAYVNLQGKFYKIKLDDLIEIFCIHIPEVIKKILKYKDELNGMELDDKDFIKFELDIYTRQSFLEKKNAIIEILTEQLLTNRALIEDFLQKSISVDDLEQLKPNNKFTYSIIDKKLNELKYSKLGIKSGNLKIKRIRKIKTYDSDDNDEDAQSNMQTSNQVNSSLVYSDI